MLLASPTQGTRPDATGHNRAFHGFYPVGFFLGPSLGQSAANNPDRRLDSWKEIAAFFGRDERTVRRWEKESALPVHRVPGGAKGRVFAYANELGQWLSTPQAVVTATSAPALPVDQIQPHPKSFALRPAAKWAVAAGLFGPNVPRKLAPCKKQRLARQGAPASRAPGPRPGHAAPPRSPKRL